MQSEIKLPNTKNKQNILVILGPTASGKTSLGVEIAHKFNGEIISADSRQVYKYMDIGTGKDLIEYKIENTLIPYHLIDVVDPKTEFNLAKFQKLANIAIEKILQKNKLPVIVGGTGLYLQALVDDYDLSSVKTDKTLRNNLEKKTTEELLKILTELNPTKVKELHISDQKNKRRLIRYIEIHKSKQICYNKKKKKNYNFILIGLTWPRELLKERIYKRLIQRLENENMVEEIAGLHKKHKVTWKRMENFGLEYKYITLYLRKKLSYDEMVEQLNIASRQFAKRQVSWFRRWEKQGTKINWIQNKDLNKFIKKLKI